MKRFISMLCAAALVLVEVLLLTVQTSAASAGNLTFALNSDGKSYYVSACDDTAEGEIVIPATYMGKPVTKIGDSAFSNCFGLTNITIPSSVTSIEQFAFFCCEGLTNITIPDGVTTIGDSAFRYCRGLTSISVPDSVTRIGERAFDGCNELTSVTIGCGVTRIGDYAFHDLRKLTKIQVDENNPAYSSDSRGVLFNKQKTSLIHAPGAISGDYTIPDSVTGIGPFAFYFCSNLTSVTIGDSVASIGTQAFQDCRGLRSITIPESVASIGLCAFRFCYELTNVYYTGTEEQKGKIIIGSMNESLTKATWHYEYNGLTYALNSDGESYYVSKCNKLVDDALEIPSTYKGKPVTGIGKRAFDGCTGLLSIEIPDSVTCIEQSSFENCSNLTAVFYRGTKEQKNSMTIGSMNTCLTDTTWHYEVEEAIVEEKKCFYCAECDDHFYPNGTRVPKPVEPIRPDAIEGEYAEEINLWLKIFVPESFKHEDARVVMTKQGGFGVETVTIKGNELGNVDAKGRYLLKMGIASGEMTSAVTYEFYDAHGNMMEIVTSSGNNMGKEATFSLLNYARSMLRTGTDAQKKMVAAMLTYGGYAQKYFGVDAQNPAYNLLTQLGMAVPSLDGVTAELITDRTIVADGGNGIKATGMQTFLDSAIYLRVYFTLAAGADIDDYKFVLTYAKPDGTVDTMELEAGYEAGKNRYYVDIEDIPAAYLDYMYNITVTNTKTNATYSVTTSVIVWVKNSLNSSSNEDQKNLLKAIYLYNQAANELFGK